MSLQKTLDYLAGDAARESLLRDPYWPKWDSPWWHALLLHEMGLTHRIPTIAIERLLTAMNTHYLKIFPVAAEEVPTGLDPYRQVLCHCALGSMEQILSAAGVDVEKELPWVRPWFLKYQLPDGGLNCDEQAYTGSRKSSPLSTIPVLEAVLFHTKRPFTDEELVFLDRGAEYFLKRGLLRRSTDGAVIDPEWLEIKFPRFYEYDFFRGYRLVAHWAKLRDRKISEKLRDEVRTLLQPHLRDDQIVLKRLHLVDPRSYNPSADGSWAWGDSKSFPLMEEVSGKDKVCEELTRQYQELKSLGAL